MYFRLAVLSGLWYGAIVRGRRQRLLPVGRSYPLQTVQRATNTNYDHENDHWVVIPALTKGHYTVLTYWICIILCIILELEFSLLKNRWELPCLRTLYLISICFFTSFKGLLKDPLPCCKRGGGCICGEGDSEIWNRS